MVLAHGVTVTLLVLVQSFGVRIPVSQQKEACLQKQAFLMVYYYYILNVITGLTA